MRNAVVVPVAVAAVIGISAFALKSREHSATSQPRPLPRSVRPTGPVDPLFPKRPPEAITRPAAGNDWVTLPPAAEFQYSLKAADRGGVEPCAEAGPKLPPDSVLPLGMGTLFLPELNFLDDHGNFDLVVHLNGEGPVRRELAVSEQPLALYTLTVPPEKSYAPLFAGSGLLGQLLTQISNTVSQRFHRPVSVRHLALSAWSAGFEGVRSILYQPEAERVEAILLIDGLHAPRERDGLESHLKPFVDFAKRAVAGERLFVVSHSSIPTPAFTSTTESAHYLIHELGGRPASVRRNDGFGLELVEIFDRGDFHVRGYAGNDKPDHCAQLFLLRSLFPALAQHWHSGR